MRTTDTPNNKRLHKSKTHLMTSTLNIKRNGTARKKAIEDMSKDPSIEHILLNMEKLILDTEKLILDTQYLINEIRLLY